MRIKRVLRPEALRRIPRQFSWIDPRLVSDHHIERCDEAALGERSIAGAEWACLKR
jgi:hypothetical protein